MTLKDEDVVARVPGVTVERLRGWVARGWLAPARGERDYAFEEIDVARIDLIRQLRDDLEIDRETVPVLLSLMDQVYGLRHELRSVMRALGEQPAETRKKIVARFRIYRGEEPG